MRFASARATDAFEISVATTRLRDMPRVADMDMPSLRETPRRGDAPKVWRERDREAAVAAVELAEVGA